MSESRWLRLNTDWHLSDWLVVLSSESRLAWVQLLCHVKINGFGGKCKAIAPIVAERLWFVNEPSIRQMLQAAENAGALVVTDGAWEVAKWNEYQGSSGNADRQKAWRQRQNRNESNALRNPTETETETETNTPKAPKGDGVSRKPFDGAVIPSTFLKAATAWEKHRSEYRHKLWKKSTWETVLKKYDGDHARFGRAVANSIENAYQGLIEPTSKNLTVVEKPKQRNEVGRAC